MGTRRARAKPVIESGLFQDRGEARGEGEVRRSRMLLRMWAVMGRRTMVGSITGVW